MKKIDFFLSPVFCLHNGAVIIEKSLEKKSITFGLLNFEDEYLKTRLSHAVHLKTNFLDKNFSVNFVKIEKDEFNLKISTLFCESESSSGFSGGLRKQNDSSDVQEDSSYDENEARALLNSLILNAKELNATDIHVEDSAVRFRVKGCLGNKVPLEKESLNAVVQRIKLLSHLNVVENKRGQDGQFVFEDENLNKIFIRVSCIPSIGKSGESESVVLRLLDASRAPLELCKLGFDLLQVEVLKRICLLQNGLVLICGPTGSGKSTTAGALLEEIRKDTCDTKKIISLEDPPEYVLPGVTQIKIKSEHDMDFSDALRRIFRQDPDVIMIGEIRDMATATIALQASLTGHLVIATLHTGTVKQAVLRMEQLVGNARFVSEVLKAVIAQKLDNGKLNAQIEVLNAK